MSTRLQKNISIKPSPQHKQLPQITKITLIQPSSILIKIAYHQKTSFGHKIKFFEYHCKQWFANIIKSHYCKYLYWLHTPYSDLHKKKTDIQICLFLQSMFFDFSSLFAFVHCRNQYIIAIFLSY